MFAEKTSVGLFLQILGDLLKWNSNHFLYFLQWCTSSSEMYPCTHLPIFSSAVWQLLTLSYCYLVRNTFSFYFSFPPCHFEINKLFSYAHLVYYTEGLLIVCQNVKENTMTFQNHTIESLHLHYRHFLVSSVLDLSLKNIIWKMLYNSISTWDV